MRVTKSPVWTGVAIAVVALATSVWLLRDRLFEPFETVVDRGFRGEAAYQHFYALGAMFVGVTLFLPRGLAGLLPARSRDA